MSKVLAAAFLLVVLALVMAPVWWNPVADRLSALAGEVAYQTRLLRWRLARRGGRR